MDDRIASGDYVHGELYTVRPDGSALTCLLSVMIIDENDEPVVNSVEYPCFSPDGQQLAFIGWDMWGSDPLKETQSYLCIVGVDGKNARRLTKFDKTKKLSSALNQAAFCFSPDGKSLAFVKEGDIWIINIDGTGLRRLTKRNHNSRPCWVAIP